MGKGGMCQVYEPKSVRHNNEEENMAVWLLGANNLQMQPYKLPPLGHIVKEPMVIGHECAGIIEEVGPGVKSLVPGDRVAMEPGITCWRCNHCRTGRYHLCQELYTLGQPPAQGALANFVVHPAD